MKKYAVLGAGLEEMVAENDLITIEKDIQVTVIDYYENMLSGTEDFVTKSY